MKKPYSALQGKIVASGETCQSIARAIGVSPQTFSMKMQGKSHFTDVEIVTIGSILNFSLADYDTCFFAPTLKLLEKNERRQP